MADKVIKATPLANISAHETHTSIIDTDKSGQITQNEQTRLVFSGAIIAGVLAYIATGHTIAGYIGMDAARIIGLSLALSGIFSFLYLLTVAADLKHTQSSYIYGFRLNFIQKMFFYDISVDVLAITPFAAAASLWGDLGWLATIFISIFLALAIVLLLIVFPEKWVRYELEATCPTCAASLNNRNKPTRLNAKKPAIIRQLISYALFMAILVLANIFIAD